jgi:signal transduction histidine kinase
MPNAAIEASIAVPHDVPVARPATAAAAGTALAAAGLGISLWVGQAKPVNGSTLLLAAASVAAALVEIEYAPKFLISGGFTFFMLDAAYAGAEATAAIVALAMTVTALTYGARRAAWAVNLGATVLPSTLAAALFQRLSLNGDVSIRALTFVWLGAGAVLAINLVLISIPLLAVLNGQPARRAFARLRPYTPVAVANVLLVGPVVLVYGQAGASGVVAAFVVVGLFAYLMRLNGLTLRRSQELETLSSERAELLARVVEAQDDERRRIAEDLHDDALQAVLTARQDVAAALAGDPTKISAASESLNEARTALRTVVFAMHPTAIAHAGAVRAIEQLADDHERRTRMAVTLDCAPADFDYPPIFVECARELLRNVARHSQASDVSIRLGKDDSSVRLVVEDNGLGLSDEDVSEAVKRGHIGLAIIRSRAAAMGGYAVVAGSDAGRGTCVEVRVPLTLKP